MPINMPQWQSFLWTGNKVCELHPDDNMHAETMLDLFLQILHIYTPRLPRWVKEFGN